MTADPGRSTGVTIALLRAGLQESLSSLTARLKAVAAHEPLPPFQVPEDSGLATLATIFHLNPDELQILALALGAELDPELCQALETVAGQKVPDIDLATRLGLLAWDALCPEAPLRHWRMVELTGSGPLRKRPIRPDERILHFVLGTTYLDQRLEGMLQLARSSGASDPMLRDRVMAAWQGAETLPVLLLAGRSARGARALAVEAAEHLGLRLYRLRASDLPTDWTQRGALAVFIDRELALSGAALLIEAEAETAEAAAGLADLLSGPTMIAAADPEMPERGPRLRIDIPEAQRSERRALWQQALGDGASAVGPELDRLSEQFALDPVGIAAAAESAALTGLAPDTLWQAAREQGRRRLEDLADRIETSAGWQDLVLPPEQMAVLQDLSHHLREAWTVNHSWGWAAKSARGLGASALFAGASGTGKTLAAEVLAQAFRLDLYRIDLSQVVSKYIGETEKNLERIFSAAEQGGAVLLFDEADALFGKRSEVKDSHDRYANVEVSYLLQRMEAYRGLAILTTNQKAAVDQAFLRRLRYVVQFPFPDVAARAEIWARVFPCETPLDGIDPLRLARLSLTGGSIRSVAFNAAFLAAGAAEPVRMAHILRAARREYTKLEKPFTGTEMEAFR